MLEHAKYQVADHWQLLLQTRRMQAAPTAAFSGRCSSSVSMIGTTAPTPQSNASNAIHCHSVCIIAACAPKNCLLGFPHSTASWRLLLACQYACLGTCRITNLIFCKTSPTSTLLLVAKEANQQPASTKTVQLDTTACRTAANASTKALLPLF
jgi:hypothetical protein